MCIKNLINIDVPQAKNSRHLTDLKPLLYFQTYPRQTTRFWMEFDCSWIFEEYYSEIESASKSPLIWITGFGSRVMQQTSSYTENFAKQETVQIHGFLRKIYQ